MKRKPNWYVCKKDDPDPDQSDLTNNRGTNAAEMININAHSV